MRIMTDLSANKANQRGRNTRLRSYCAGYLRRYMLKELTWYHIMVLYLDEAKAPENPGANI